MTDHPARLSSTDLSPPKDVLWIARHLEKAGFETWAVGGAVRDALTGGHPDDWDLTTSARPSDVRRIFRRTVPLGIEHGTVGVIAPSRAMYEVTTFRRDVETFGRHARVAFADRVEDDLDRRDFTINAIAWHPLRGDLLDPHGGLDDLKAAVLRTVGEPERRFEEDRLRVLRALRFAGTFSLAIEPATWKAIRASAGKLDALSPERVREELRKVLSGQADPSTSLELYAESGVLRHLYPELDRCRERRKQGESVWTLQLRAVAAVPPARMRVRLAALLHDVGSCDEFDGVGKPPPPNEVQQDATSRAEESLRSARSAAVARELLRRLRFSNADVDHVTHLIAQRSPRPGPKASEAELRRWVRRVGREFVNDCFRLHIAIARAAGGGENSKELRALHRRVHGVLSSDPPLRVADLAIGGSELRDLGITVGPRYREILDSLLERVLDDPSLNEPEALLELARGLGRTDDSTSP